MASQFDRWEKDPFFFAAEEVQESADRMESAYRTWIHANKDSSTMWNPEELRRDLQTTLGTTKWQLEEFERAVRSSYPNSSITDTKQRHRDFITAMKSQISNVEKTLHKSSVSSGKPPHPWVRLDEGERDELALFLSGPTPSAGNSKVRQEDVDDQSPPECSNNSAHSAEWGQVGITQDVPGHRRTASANADIGNWNIAVSENESFGSSKQPPRRIPSFSELVKTVQSTSKSKWSNYGHRKLKLPVRLQQNDKTLSQSQPLNTGHNGCNERSNGCLDGCDDYNKEINGWYGAMQRQLRRSQYHIQYNRPIQLAVLIFILVCFTVLFVDCGI
jgi:hypothetical protein